MEHAYKELSLEDCHTIIHNDTRQINAEVVSYKMEPYSDKVMGLLGQHFKLEITYKAEENIKTSSYFMKIINTSSKIIFEICMSINAFQKEDFFYNTLLKDFKRFNIDTSFAPQCYLTKPYIIVLEDMCSKNYISSGSINLNVEYCKKALETVAKFHSCSILYETAKSEDMGKPFNLFKTYPDVLKNVFFGIENNLAREWLNKSIDGVYELIKIIPENHIKSKDFQDKFLQFVNCIEKIEDSFENHTKTLLHGDLWSNNFLFRVDEVVIDSVLLDFQILKYGIPIVDVMNFLYCNTRRKFRDAHTKELLDYYYECVKENLSKHQYLNIPSKEEYLTISSDLRILIKLLCLCDRTVTLMFDNDLTLESDESLRNYLLDERTVNLVKVYNKDAAFREIMEEDILELRDLLFEKV